MFNKFVKALGVVILLVASRGSAGHGNSDLNCSTTQNTKNTKCINTYVKTSWQYVVNVFTLLAIQ